MFSYPVNYPKSTFPKLIRVRKVVCGSFNSVEIELQGFSTCYFIRSFKEEEQVNTF